MACFTVWSVGGHVKTPGKKPEGAATLGHVSFLWLLGSILESSAVVMTRWSTAVAKLWWTFSVPVEVMGIQGFVIATAQLCVLTNTHISITLTFFTKLVPHFFLHSCIHLVILFRIMDISIAKYLWQSESWKGDFSIVLIGTFFNSYWSAALYSFVHLTF